MALADLPARKERSAPTFDETRPEGLQRYFNDLQILLDGKGVTDDKTHKEAAVRYVEVETEELWTTTNAWKDQTKTFAEFKDEIFKLYPGASKDRTYTIQDLDLVTGHYARTGILTSLHLGEYYRKFLRISRYLIEKGKLSDQEQSWSFFRGFQPNLEQQVRLRLQLQYLDRYSDDHYDIADIYTAASFVVTGSATIPLAPLAQGPLAINPPATATNRDPTMAKIEALLTTAFANFGEMFKSAIQNNQAQPAGPKPKSTGYATSGTSAPSSNLCNFCGDSSHFIRECPEAEEAVKAGKCKRDVTGKVVLPSGAAVPKGPGRIRDRMEEWHRQNPGQMAAQLFLEVTAPATAPTDEAADQSFSHPILYAEQNQRTEPAGIYALNRHRLRPEVVIDSQPPRSSGRAGRSNDAGDADGRAAPQQKERPRMAQEAQPRQNLRDDNQEPTHPYASVSDAINRKATGPDAARPTAQRPAAGRPDQAASKVHDPRIADSVFDRAMQTPITITHRELLSLAPEVRTRIADISTKKRTPREPLAQAMIEELPEAETYAATGNQQRFERHATHMPAAFVTATTYANTAEDEVEAYFGANSKNPTDLPLSVAAESNALRAIQPVVDGQDRVEAILDPGCQIVAMSEEVANALALSYDPTVRLNMVSANGGVDQSLGLARNVPFLVGDITLFLQVHVLRAPAYDILLGRPFDVLTQSVVRNYANETQTITIIDPNSGKQAIVPTIPRGSFRFADRRSRALKTVEQQQDF